MAVNAAGSSSVSHHAVSAEREHQFIVGIDRVQYDVGTATEDAELNISNWRTTSSAVVRMCLIGQ